MGSLTGQLLLSNASLFDPSFRRTVVLIGQHDEEGAVGVVLNRPFEVTVDEAVPSLAELVREGEALFHGGPVQPEAAVVVVDFEDPSEAGVVAFDSIGFLAEEADRVDLGTIRRARVFAGYSGWGPRPSRSTSSPGTASLPTTARRSARAAPAGASTTTCCSPRCTTTRSRSTGRSSTA